MFYLNVWRISAQHGGSAHLKRFGEFQLFLDQMSKALSGLVQHGIATQSPSYSSQKQLFDNKINQQTKLKTFPKYKD